MWTHLINGEMNDWHRVTSFILIFIDYFNVHVCSIVQLNDNNLCTHRRSSRKRRVLSFRLWDFLRKDKYLNISRLESNRWSHYALFDIYRLFTLFNLTINQWNIFEYILMKNKVITYRYRYIISSTFFIIYRIFCYQI